MFHYSRSDDDVPLHRLPSLPSLPVEKQPLEGCVFLTNDADDVVALREIIVHTSSVSLVSTPYHMLTASSMQFPSMDAVGIF